MGKTRNGQEDRKKRAVKKQHVKIDDMKEQSDLICGKAAVGGNNNSTRDNDGNHNGLRYKSWDEYCTY